MSFARRSQPIERRQAPATLHGVNKREANRRLTSLGLSRHHDEEIVAKALEIVARFLVWTTHQPSALSGRRAGERYIHDGKDWLVGRIDPAHGDTRGSYAADFGNVIPLTDHEHRLSHNRPDFLTADEHARLARIHAVHFFRDHPADAAWMMLNAGDGVTIQLASEGKSSR